MPDDPAIRAAIEPVEDHQLHRSLGELGVIRRAERAPDGTAVIEIAVPTPDHEGRADLAQRIADAVQEAAGVPASSVEFVVMDDDQRQEVMGRVRGAHASRVGAAGSKTRTIAVSSGKGGVGKSSITVNLAVALVDAGRTVGIIDADVWGYSIPKMLGAVHAPTVIDQSLVPPEAYGVKVMSIDWFVPADQAVVWRGPMLHKALEQFLADVHWDDPDYLLIDMPPGTGDVALSISQFLPRAQVILVTTPQPTAQRVAKRAALMAEKVNQEILGIVENMSWFTGDDGKRYLLFGEGGGAQLAEELGVGLLGQIPLLPAMRAGADDGLPVKVAAPGSEVAGAFDDLAAAVEARKPRIRTHPELIIR